MSTTDTLSGTTPAKADTRRAARVLLAAAAAVAGIGYLFPLFLKASPPLAARAAFARQRLEVNEEFQIPFQRSLGSSRDILLEGRRTDPWGRPWRAIRPFRQDEGGRITAQGWIHVYSRGPDGVDEQRAPPHAPCHENGRCNHGDDVMFLNFTNDRGDRLCGWGRELLWCLALLLAWLGSTLLSRPRDPWLEAACAVLWALLPAALCAWLLDWARPIPGNFRPDPTSTLASELAWLGDAVSATPWGERGPVSILLSCLVPWSVLAGALRLYVRRQAAEPEDPLPTPPAPEDVLPA